MDKIPGTDIQLFYAAVLDWTTKVVFVLILCTFAVYVSKILTPFVPLPELPQYWGLPAHHYLEATGMNTGWGWMEEMHHGDILNFLPIAILASVTIFGYLCIVGKFFRRGERLLGMIVILQIIVLGLAASGVIGTGGH